jgi:hypothetical protein
MTGPEHHLEAERLIAMARESRHADLYGHHADTQSALILADAQVHATLALAATITAGTTSASSQALAEPALGRDSVIPVSAREQR